MSTNIHSCDYHCDRPECIRRQRDELRGNLAEVVRLRQALWDAFAAAGGDTDGQPTPEALATDIVPLMLDCVRELRAAEDESLGVIDILARRLAEVCIALKGEPPPGVRFSYHDLGYLSSSLKTEVTRLADDAMHLDAEREYWQREAATARAERDALRSVVAAANLRAQTIHNLTYEYGVPDDHPLHCAVHELIGDTMRPGNVEALDRATAAHIDDLNDQATKLRAQVDALRKRIVEAPRNLLMIGDDWQDYACVELEPGE